jgi:hypothetical protein
LYRCANYLERHQGAAGVDDAAFWLTQRRFSWGVAIHQEFRARNAGALGRAYGP